MDLKRARNLMTDSVYRIHQHHPPGEVAVVEGLNAVAVAMATVVEVVDDSVAKHQARLRAAPAAVAPQLSVSQTNSVSTVPLAFVDGRAVYQTSGAIRLGILGIRL